MVRSNWPTVKSRADRVWEVGRGAGREGERGRGGERRARCAGDNRGRRVKPHEPCSA